MTAKSDVVVKLVLVFFISLLSFSIGTFVGKKYSDNQHKLAALEPGHGAADAHREVASEEHGKTESSMSDDDIAKIAEEFADDETMPTVSAHDEETAAHDDHAKAEDAHGAKAVAHAPEKPTHAEKSKTEEPSTPAKNLVAGKNPTESMAKKAHAETRLPSSLPKDVAQYSVGKFTVQVAAFGTETEAKRRAEDLKHQGYSAFYVPAQVKGKTWYRVSVGLFATEKEAKEYKSSFTEKAKVENTIIQKIAQ